MPAFHSRLRIDAMSNSAPFYFSGLDLAQTQDHAALAVLERTSAPDPAREGKALRFYAVRHLKRYPLGTPYPRLVASLVETFGRPPLPDSTLVVDQTGVGRPVVEMLRQQKISAVIRPVNITAGHQANPTKGGGNNVPKKELVSTLQVLLQHRRIKVARDLADAALLAKELENFKVKVTAAANETFEAWRGGDHDDLVMAVALAAWAGERMQTGALCIFA
jgi:hypothetical protein